MAIPYALIGDTLSLSLAEFDQKLILRNRSDDTLDCSVGFEDEDIVIGQDFENLITIIPGRTLSHVYGGTITGVINFSFRAPIWTLDASEVLPSFRQIKDFFDNAEGGLIDVYWVKDDDAEWRYAYLAACRLSAISNVYRTGKKMREISYVEMTVQSLAKDWTYSNYPDTTPAAVVARGPWLHTASTNDGSVALAVIRESDQQALLEVTDQGELRTLGAIKSNQDLTAWDLDLENL